jgi:hypothetical protein
MKSDRTFDNNFKASVDDEFKDKVIPRHYMYAKITPIDIIENDLPLEQQIGFFKGIIFKYLFRSEQKNGLEDYLKCSYYLNKMIDAINNNREEYEAYRKHLQEKEKKLNESESKVQI